MIKEENYMNYKHVLINIIEIFVVILLISAGTLSILTVSENHNNNNITVISNFSDSDFIGQSLTEGWFFHPIYSASNIKNIKYNNDTQIINSFKENHTTFYNINFLNTIIKYDINLIQIDINTNTNFNTIKIMRENSITTDSLSSTSKNYNK